MEWKVFAEGLIRLGYFRYLPEKHGNLERLLASMQNSQTLFHPNVHRHYPADAERLTEEGFGKFIRIIKPILRNNGVKVTNNGVKVTNIKELCSRTGYTIHLDGKEFTLYTEEEIERIPFSLWEITTQRTFSIINNLLRDAKSEELLFTYSGGNDQYAFFLTQQLYDLLQYRTQLSEVRELDLYKDFA